MIVRDAESIIKRVENAKVISLLPFAIFFCSICVTFSTAAAKYFRHHSALPFCAVMVLSPVIRV